MSNSSKGSAPASPGIPLNITRLPDGSPIPATSDPVAAEFIRHSETSRSNALNNSVNLRVVQGSGGSDPPSSQNKPISDEEALHFLDMFGIFVDENEKPEGATAPFFAEYYEQQLKGKSPTKTYQVPVDEHGVPHPVIPPRGSPGGTANTSSSSKSGSSGTSKTPTPSKKATPAGGSDALVDPYAAVVLGQTEMFIKQQERILRKEIADALPEWANADNDGDAMNRALTQLICREVTVRIANFLVPLMTNYLPKEVITRAIVGKFGPNFAEVAAKLKDGTYLCSLPCVCDTLKCDDPACKICYPEGYPACGSCA